MKTHSEGEIAMLSLHVQSVIRKNAADFNPTNKKTR